MLANTAATNILNGTVTQNNFAGPPMVLFADIMPDTSDPRWQAMESFAQAVGGLVGMEAPLIGLDVVGGSYAADLATLYAALQAFSSFFDTNFAGPFSWSDGVGLYQNIPVCGPFFAIPSLGGPNDHLADTEAWNQSKNYLRCNARHLYGIGMLACGGGVPEKMPTPPVYNPDELPANYTNTLNTLLSLWRQGGAATSVNISTLQNLEATDPTRLGISRRTHPALVPYIILSTP